MRPRGTTVYTSLSNIWLQLTNTGAAHSALQPLCLLSEFADEPSVRQAACLSYERLTGSTTQPILPDFPKRPCDVRRS